MQPRGLRGRAGLDGLDLDALGAGRALDAEVRALDVAGRLELRDDRLRGVDRDREADPHVAVRAAPGGDLRVDPDDAAARVEQRTARVARVERGVGLDHVVDPEPARRGEAALERRHHAGGERLLEPERVADRDRRVADLQARGAAELERVEVEPVGLDPQQRQVGVRILADGERRDGVVVGERDLDPRRALDDVGVGEDQALVVEHEARAGRLRAAGRPEDVERRLLGLDGLGADEDDAGRAAAVDLGRAQRPGGARQHRRALAGDRRLDDACVAAGVDESGGDQHRRGHSAAHDGGQHQARPAPHPSAHPGPRR